MRRRNLLNLMWLVLLIVMAAGLVANNLFLMIGPVLVGVLVEYSTRP